MLLKEWIASGKIAGMLLQAGADSMLYSRGEQNQGVYYLLKGQVSLTSEKGQKYVIKEGALLGLPDVLSKFYSHSVITSTDTELWFISLEEVLQAMQLYPAIRLYLVRKMSNQATLRSPGFE